MFVRSCYSCTHMNMLYEHFGNLLWVATFCFFFCESGSKVVAIIKWDRTLALNWLASSEQDAKQFVMLATWAYTSFFGNVVNMSVSRVQAVFCAFFSMDRFTLFLVCGLLLTFNFVTYWISLSEFLKGQKRLNNNVLLCWLLTYDMINS